MSNLVKRRILAFTVDYILIAIYASLLYIITTLIDPREMSPYKGAIVGFISLTLPVFLYFYLSEMSRFNASFGKQWMKIKVECQGANSRKSLLTRNILKFLPWEIAHLGVHWLIYFSSEEILVPIWVWILLIVPQLLVIAYLISIFISKGKQSLYDKMAQVQVTQV